MRNRLFSAIAISMLTICSSYSATISGKVTTDDEPNGAPAANISLYQNNSPTGLGSATDLDGNFKITNVPKGVYIVHFDYVGYKSAMRTVVLSDDNSVEVVNVNLSSSVIAGKEVVVTASITKHEVSVSNTPLRVEVMVPEEVQDKIAFTTTVDGALKYSGGIVVNTSKNIYEAENIRLRGMDSRYLLLLENRSPVVGFQPDEVGLWTIPLVGVKQIEVVKGDHSALYGSGNSGIISAVMRSPFNDTIDVFALMRSNFEDDHYTGMYVGKRFEKIGISGIFSGEILGESDSAKFRHIIEPRIDFRTGKTNAFISADILGVDGNGKNFFQRYGLHSHFETPISSKIKFSAQGQFADQKRNYTLSNGNPDANSQIVHGTIQFSRSINKFTTIAGMDGYLENWSMKGDSTDYSSKIGWVGAFFQTEFMLNQKLSLLYVGRGSRNYIDANWLCWGLDPLWVYTPPDILLGTNHMLSFLFKPKYDLSFRFSGNYGTAPPKSHYIYYSEDTSFVLIPPSGLKMEQFFGANVDTKIIRDFGLFSGTVNISAFATSIKNRADIVKSLHFHDPTLNDIYCMSNSSSGYEIFGAELFSRFDFGDDASLLLGYTYFSPDEEYKNAPGTMLSLPHHQGNIELDWEIESTGIRMELEGKALSGQELPQNPYRETAPPYTVWGETFEFTMWRIKFFAGLENIFNFRQTDAGPLWGPREGREFYVGAKTAL